MPPVKLTILGSGSAVSDIRAFHSSQLLEMRGKQFMIDCGEGTQMRLRQYHASTARLSHIFISHLHGDHCLGLPGVLSTFGMMGRTAPLTIHAHVDYERVFGEMIRYFCAESPFEIRFEAFDPYKRAVIYEDRSLSVTTLPLKHKVPTAGFLFEEKATERHLIREMLDAYEVPVSRRKAIKEGANFVTPDGETVPNERLTRPAEAPKRYAYCSDTAYSERIVPWIEGVDCLFHEASFLEEDLRRAKETAHSSARQAAEIARAAKVGRLIVGHFSARYKDTAAFGEEASAVFPDTTVAYDGMSYTF